MKEYFYYCDEKNEVIICGLKQKQIKIANPVLDLSKGEIQDILISLVCPKEVYIWNYIGEL